MKNCGLLLVILSIICSCNKYGDNDVRLIKDEHLPKVLCGKVLDIPDIYSPSRIYWKDSLLLFKDNVSTDAQLFVHNLRTCSTNSFIGRGRGPGEMLGAFYVAFSDDNTFVWDITQGKVLSAVTDSLILASYYPTCFLKASVTWREVSCITGLENNIIGLGNRTNNRIVKIQECDSIKVLVEYNPDLLKKYDADYSLQAYEGVIKANDTKNACVVACRYADQLEIVDFKTGKPLFVKGPDLFEPESNVVTVKGGRTLAHPLHERKGYIDVCCDDELIYVLYSGRELKEKNSSYGKTLRVFTWDGEYVSNYSFDRDIISIDIDPDTKNIYAISSLDEIVRYSL